METVLIIGYGHFFLCASLFRLGLQWGLTLIWCLRLFSVVLSSTIYCYSFQFIPRLISCYLVVTAFHWQCGGLLFSIVVLYFVTCLLAYSNSVYYAAGQFYSIWFEHACQSRQLNAFWKKVFNLFADLLSPRQKPAYNNALPKVRAGHWSATWKGLDWIVLYG